MVVPSSGSTIQRWCLVGTDHFAALFHQKAVADARLAQLLEDDVLGFVIGRGNKISGTLYRNLQLFDLSEIADEAAPRLAGGRNHDVQGRGDVVH